MSDLVDSLSDMSHVRRDPRLVDVPPDQRDRVAEIIRRQGIPAAQRTLGLGRTALLGIVARGTCMAGTAALLREALRRLEAA